MSLSDVFKSIAETVIDAFNDVPKYFYFHSLGTTIYDPVTGENTEDGAIEIVDATDLSMVATKSLKSVSTDLSDYNLPIDDIQWFKISGFTNSTNNGYTRATTATTTGVTLSQKTVETEVAGASITIIGPLYKTKGVFRRYELEETYDSPIELNDIQLIVASNHLTPTPKVGDWLLWNDVKYGLLHVGTDPAGATWKMQLRGR